MLSNDEREFMIDYLTHTIEEGPRQIDEAKLEVAAMLKTSSGEEIADAASCIIAVEARVSASRKLIKILQNLDKALLNGWTVKELFS